MTYAFKYDAFKYDFTILDKQKCLSCLFLIQTSGETEGEFPKSGLSVIQQMLYMRDDLNANKTIVFMVSTNIYIYIPLAIGYCHLHRLESSFEVFLLCLF